MRYFATKPCRPADKVSFTTMITTSSVVNEKLLISQLVRYFSSLHQMPTVFEKLKGPLGSSVESLEYLPALLAVTITRLWKNISVATTCVVNSNAIQNTTILPKIQLTECCEWQGIATSWKNKLKAVYKVKRHRQIVAGIAQVKGNETKQDIMAHQNKHIDSPQIANFPLVKASSLDL